jgi:nucleoside-diphosphate-sugar epimerase
MRILVTGASSQIGDFLLPRLKTAGHEVHAVSRAPRDAVPGLSWFPADLEQPEALVQAANGCSAIIHLAPIWSLPLHLADLAGAGVGRVVAFSSTSRFGKESSRDPAEQALVRRLADAEQTLEEGCGCLDLCRTVLRPTLIYGSGRDKNVSSIARFVRRFGFFPIAGAGSGLRQPVHADDLAQAVCAVLESDITCGRSYNLSGGETLSYRHMVERIFASVGHSPRVVPLSLGPLRLLLRLLSILPRFRYVKPEMADRMNRDLVYDHEDAVRDFGYAPLEFRP